MPIVFYAEAIIIYASVVEVDMKTIGYTLLRPHWTCVGNQPLPNIAI